ncbi:MAG: ATP-binding protein [Rhizobiales bacterium]|nr:ATP-binding protein [Hyphomicrobiales bacterium]NRB13742.1 ATP-binding protein [Hyphomicrobiales bacterium]
MNNIKKTKLWQVAFPSGDTFEHHEHVKYFVDAFEKLRDKAGILVNEISSELPNYTVHDISHLDALWEVGSQIINDEIVLNPAEGFVLGGAFLLHDAAMTCAAYPGGLEEIKQTNAWKKVVARLQMDTDKEEIDEKLAIEIFLREQHAIKAEKLPFVTWPHPTNGREYSLIENEDLLNKFGQFIGQVAASHWWGHEKLEHEFKDKIIPAPSPFPSGWSIDLLKIACILRAADASQIDDRRSPGFLWALRQNKISGLSKSHWNFQNKLTQAQCRDDALYFGSTSSFTREEAADWWVLFDTLTMIDTELRGIDSILERNRPKSDRLKAKRVANIENPIALAKLIGTEDWHPVNTAFSISDIPGLIEKLGGAELYGNDSFVAVRELIQNAMDATRMRKMIEKNAQDSAVKVELSFKGKNPVLKVSDMGVGMSADEMMNKLLSFGNCGWLADQAIGEYTDILPNKDSVSGRYGIGFFSIFMLGNKVKVKSKRFDRSPDDTVILEFKRGLNERPILYKAEKQDRQTQGGTSIEVECDIKKLSKDSFWKHTGLWVDDEEQLQDLHHLLGSCFPCSEIKIQLETPYSSHVIDGSNWQTEPAEIFYKRVTGAGTFRFKEHDLARGGRGNIVIEQAVKALQIIKDIDGNVVGRASLLPRAFDYWRAVSGSFVSRGAAVGAGNFAGVFLGQPTKAARDSATPVACQTDILKWANNQASIWRGLLRDQPAEQMRIASYVSALQGELGELKICKIVDEFYSLTEFAELLKSIDGIWLAEGYSISHAETYLKQPKRCANIIEVSDDTPDIFSKNIRGVIG